MSATFRIAKSCTSSKATIWPVVSRSSLAPLSKTTVVCRGVMRDPRDAPPRVVRIIVAQRIAPRHVIVGHDIDGSIFNANHESAAGCLGEAEIRLDENGHSFQTRESLRAEFAPVGGNRSFGFRRVHRRDRLGCRAALRLRRRRAAVHIKPDAHSDQADNNKQRQAHDAENEQRQQRRCTPARRSLVWLRPRSRGGRLCGLGRTCRGGGNRRVRSVSQASLARRADRRRHLHDFAAVGAANRLPCHRVGKRQLPTASRTAKLDHGVISEQVARSCA